MNKSLMLSTDTCANFAMDITKLAVENGMFVSECKGEIMANEIADFYETFLNRIASNEE